MPGSLRGHAWICGNSPGPGLASSPQIPSHPLPSPLALPSTLPSAGLCLFLPSSRTGLPTGPHGVGPAPPLHLCTCCSLCLQGSGPSLHVAPALLASGLRSSVGHSRTLPPNLSSLLAFLHGTNLTFSMYYNYLFIYHLSPLLECQLQGRHQGGISACFIHYFICHTVGPQYPREE